MATKPPSKPMATKPPSKPPCTKFAAKDKLRRIMEAASALTALGEEESTGCASPAPPSDNEVTEAEKEPLKRYIPEHKKPDAALTFPEKLMNLMKFAEKVYKEGFCIAWLPDGKSFVISNPDEFTRQILPKFFKATKFSSFTRKLYRWGFRQVNRGIGPDDPIIFGNEHFQRDKAEEMSKMRSITAASSRKAEAQTIYGGKRALDVREGPDRKRALFDHLLHQKAALMHSHARMYGASIAPTGTVSLTSALRPSLGLGVPHGHSHFSQCLPAMMSKHMDILGQQNKNLIKRYMPHNVGTQGHQLYPSSTCTADIVNAAISALRYAS